MSIKQKKKNNITKDMKILLTAIIMFFLFALMLHPVLFDFRQIPIWHKVLMIASTVLFFATIITFIVFVELAMKKSSDVERKKKVQFRFLYIIVLLCAAYFSLGYFNPTIWGTLHFFWVISFLFLMMFGSYYIVENNFSTLFNKEKIPMIVLSIAIFCCNIALMLNENRDISYTLLKIAVGIGYVILTVIFIKLTVLSRRNASSKNIVLFLMICITLPTVVLLTFPFYVKWCGLIGQSFDTFVSVYAAIVGGGLTLVGVAWTIKKTEHDKKELAIKEAKPIFSFEMILQNSEAMHCSKVCIDSIEEKQKYQFGAAVIIENSNHSVFTIERIYHDKEWTILEGNKVALPNSKIQLNFSFNNFFDAVLEVSDALGNKYYYLLKYLTTPQKDNQFTIREIIEIDKSMLTEKGVEV